MRPAGWGLQRALRLFSDAEWDGGRPTTLSAGRGMDWRVATVVGGDGEALGG